MYLKTAHPEYLKYMSALSIAYVESGNCVAGWQFAYKCIECICQWARMLHLHVSDEKTLPGVYSKDRMHNLQRSR